MRTVAHTPMMSHTSTIRVARRASADKESSIWYGQGCVSGRDTSAHTALARKKTERLAAKGKMGRGAAATKAAAAAAAEPTTGPTPAEVAAAIEDAVAEVEAQREFFSFSFFGGGRMHARVPREGRRAPATLPCPAPSVAHW